MYFVACTNMHCCMELSGAGVKGSSLELFTAARTITGKTGGQVIAVVIGHGTDEAVKAAAACAPDAIIRVDDARFAEYRTAAYTNVLTALAKKYGPDAVMVSATKNGKDLAPRLARRLGTGITANCTELSVEAESGLISWNMPAPGGIMATILCSDTRPQMGTICPGAFRKADSVQGAEVEIIDETAEEFEDTLRLVREVGYDSIFAFIYSPRKGTPAADMDDPVSYEEKTERFARLMALHHENIVRINENFVGKIVKVLCATPAAPANPAFFGRSSGNKLIRFTAPKGSSLYGKFVNVKIDRAGDVQIYGEAVL